MCLVEVVMCENAETAIFSRTEGLKCLGLGDLPIWMAGNFAGGWRFSTPLNALGFL